MKSCEHITTDVINSLDSSGYLTVFHREIISSSVLNWLLVSFFLEVLGWSIEWKHRNDVKAKNQKSVTLFVLIALSHLMSCQGHFLISLSNEQNEIYSYGINLLVVMSASIRFLDRASSDGNVEENEVPSIIRDKYLWWETKVNGWSGKLDFRQIRT